MPALLVEGLGWRSEWLDPGRVPASDLFDVAVVSIDQIDVLPRIVRSARATILDVAEGVFDRRRPVASDILALSNRVAALVVHGRRGEFWARRAFGRRVPIVRIDDVAARPADLAAAALRFDLGRDRRRGPEPAPAPFDLWFCEAGDSIHPREIEALKLVWSEPSPVARIVAAPELVVDWLRQAGIRFVAGAADAAT
ncbi:MAG: hypothetical protein EON88_36750, partial [Brevundimonas sp.]